jgi:WD40 repeat protein
MNLQDNNHYIESLNTKDSDKILYKNQPNIRFKENVINDFNHSYWICDTFDVYYPSNEKDLKELYLIYSFLYKKEINILRISDKKIIKSLSGHSNYICKVKNFYNEKDNNNYLLSSDWSHSLFVWNLDNNYEIKYKIFTGYTNYLYSFLLYFKLNYIITSTIGHDEEIDYLKIYSFGNGELIKDFLHTDILETLDLMIWEKESNEIYIVMCCYEKISIYNLLNGELYCDLSPDIQESCGNYYFSGFISYNNKYLFTSSSEGYINIWDLNQKILIKTIILPESSLFKIIPWSVYINYSKDKNDLKLYRNINNYILVCDKKKLGIFNINIIFRNEIDYNEITKKIYELNEEVFYQHKVLSFFKNKGNQPIKTIKKIKHPLYQDSILCSDDNKNIDLWINNPPIMIDIFNK